VLLRPKADYYASANPTAADILLIVEVADTSLEYDRGAKAQLYAEARVPEYWVADVKNDCLFACSEPHDRSYRQVRQFHHGDLIAPLLLPECRLQIDVLLP
jgi:Uma2 family endonuclease